MLHLCQQKGSFCIHTKQSLLSTCYNTADADHHRSDTSARLPSQLPTWGRCHNKHLQQTASPHSHLFSKHNQMYHFNSSLITVLCVSFQELRSDSWKCSYCTRGKKEGHQTFGLESCKWLKWNLCINWKLQSSTEKTKCSDPRVVLEVNKLLLMER